MLFSLVLIIWHFVLALQHLPIASSFGQSGKSCCCCGPPPSFTMAPWLALAGRGGKLAPAPICSLNFLLCLISTKSLSWAHTISTLARYRADIFLFSIFGAHWSSKKKWKSFAPINRNLQKIVKSVKIEQFLDKGFLSFHKCTIALSVEISPSWIYIFCVGSLQFWFWRHVGTSGSEAAGQIMTSSSSGGQIDQLDPFSLPSFHPTAIFAIYNV